VSKGANLQIHCLLLTLEKVYLEHGEQVCCLLQFFDYIKNCK
jgi:hypothetical protein